MATLNNRVLLACVFVLAQAAAAGARDYVLLGLHARVQYSDTIVLARVVDPERAVLSVERVLKGETPTEITLVDYIDPFAAAADRKPLLANARELIFLTTTGGAYAPLQSQHGRLEVDGDRLIDSSARDPRSLSATIASIERLVALQTQAARSETEANQAYVAAFANADLEVQQWASQTSFQQITVPSPALVDAFLARWPKDGGAVANAMVKWRIQRAAPHFAATLTTSPDADERASAAMALGGTGDVTFLPLLRRVAEGDESAQARALAYHGIMLMIGPDSLGDLRRGVMDLDLRVQTQAVIDAYNLLELERPDRRWPPASSALVAEVRAFLMEMERKPSVSQRARSMLARIAKDRP